MEGGGWPQPITPVARSDTTGVTEVFKKALAGVDPTFRAQVGTSTAGTWNGTGRAAASEVRGHNNLIGLMPCLNVPHLISPENDLRGFFFIQSIVSGVLV